MIFAISDLHLSLSTNKPMDVFGGDWHDYVKRIENNWQTVVSNEDTVIIPGDISWAMKLEDALSDFAFIEKLNGKKIIAKGNHDYFWETANKMEKFFIKNEIKSIKILHNNYYCVENVGLCGTKGYNDDLEKTKQQNQKILNRETLRLEKSILEAKNAGCEEIIVFLHYPPVGEGYEITPLIDLLINYGVKKCYYGHLHGTSLKNAIQGNYKGVDFNLISADYLQFMPLKIL